MTTPAVRNVCFRGLRLTWEQAGVYVPVVSVRDVATALGVDEDVLVKDFEYSGDGFNILWGSDAGETCFEFDSLWDYLKDDCPFESAKDLWATLFANPT